ncbi:molybdopterin biosynthesis protein [Effusibacillus lacus]|uniref:Molybdopterin molybdenumtransferase n=1 Tax=Effusibacillus lacus TaxID=1348429 RepID=A0A292YM26_9BACL|nr:molybdopterin molybdochelatase [Effusibacillus lacus]GAX89961.1 molybdopterin biosynthesis protein [Effusibacillus lacus]
MDALGRVTAEPIFAEVSMPNYHASAMDGIAVKASSTYSAHEKNPLKLRRGTDFQVIDTGDPIPEQFDAVIMIENVHMIDEDTYEIIEPASPWQHIRQIGEDVVAGELILPAHHVLRPVDLGAMLAGGVVEVPVISRPKAAIIPTGTELVYPKKKIERGEIPEFNGTVFASYLQTWGAEPVYKGIVEDNYVKIKEAVLEAVETSDFVLMNAGSSAGSEDFTVHVIQELGEVMMHGVATRPGKPVVIGQVKGKPVIGLPGYPVSAYLALEWFARPLVYKYLGLSEPVRTNIKATLGRRVVSVMGAEDFVRMTIGAVRGKFIANPLTRAAGVTMSMVRADGLLRIPTTSLGYEQGEEVDIELYRPLEQIENTMVFAGSHDMTLDLLATAIHKAAPDRFMSSAHVGSMGGILAIRKGEAHAAGVHLFDENTGEYNIPFVNQYLRDVPYVLVNLVYRQQGWIVPSGNPLGIQKIEDLKRDGLTYINRQRGAGTRLLFDYLLKQAGMKPEDVYGYNREDFSHLSVAAAVAGGTADCGLGILSAAKAFQLGFVPVAEERYDLLMTREFYESEAGQLLLSVMTSERFRRQVEDLGGYSCRDTGKVVYES